MKVKIAAAMDPDSIARVRLQLSNAFLNQLQAILKEVALSVAADAPAMNMTKDFE